MKSPIEKYNIYVRECIKSNVIPLLFEVWNRRREERLKEDTVLVSVPVTDRSERKTYMQIRVAKSNPEKQYQDALEQAARFVNKHNEQIDAKKPVKTKADPVIRRKRETPMGKSQLEKSIQRRTEKYASALAKIKQYSKAS